MLVVGLFDLVLDHYPAVFLSSVLAQQVSSERPDILSCASSWRSMPNASPRSSRFSAGQPWGEVLVFTRPDFAQITELIRPSFCVPLPPSGAVAVARAGRL